LADRRPGRGFFQVGRGQIDGNSTKGELAVAVAQGRSDSLSGFLNRCVGQADYVECGQALGHIDFNLDNVSVQAHHGTALCHR